MLTRSKPIPIPIKQPLPVTLRSEPRSDESGNKAVQEKSFLKNKLIYFV